MVRARSVGMTAMFRPMGGPCSRRGGGVVVGYVWSVGVTLLGLTVRHAGHSGIDPPT